MAAHLAAVETRLEHELDQLAGDWTGSTDDFVGDTGEAAADADLHFDPPALLRDLISRGGKRTRPAMTFFGWVAADVRGERRGHEDMVLAAAALEMLHAFALVHDDVMDESPVRRGRPTVHHHAATAHARADGLGDRVRFGDSIAVLVGDLAHSEADRMAAALPHPMRRVWQQTVLELIKGQLWDVAGSAAADRRESFARRVARQKTGFYTVSRPLQLGAVAAGAGDDALRALSRFGRHAGEAFALRDDLLGVYGDPLTTGKPAGDDIRSGKPTVLLALATDALTGRAADALTRAGTAAMTDAEVRVVQDAMAARGVVATVERMIDDRITEAASALDVNCLSAVGVEWLTAVVDDLARRGR